MTLNTAIASKFSKTACGAWDPSIDAWCKENNVGAINFAKALDVNPSTVRRWRNGMRMQIDHILSIHQVTEIPLEKIVDVKSAPPELLSEFHIGENYSDSKANGEESPKLAGSKSSLEKMLPRSDNDIKVSGFLLPLSEPLDNGKPIPAGFRVVKAFERPKPLGTHMTCQFPIFENNVRDGRMMCGQPRFDRGDKRDCPYCLKHAKIAYINFQA
jgi:hypothetical protein